MKLDWKKDDKRFYSPPARPELIRVPRFGFFAVAGQANPDSDAFALHVQALYALSYAVKMSPKKGLEPEGYREYSVFPLEGVWDLTEAAREARAAQGAGAHPIDRDSLVFDLMIRQPDFVTPDYAHTVLDRVRAKEKDNPFLGAARFDLLEEGLCAQMLHLGPYADEPASFQAMEAFVSAQGMRRVQLTHREIYLSDPRRTDLARLKTVLRFQVGT